VRLALISDQHANDVAFRALLEDVERLGVEEIVCLGDVAQGGAEPAQTLDRLAALGCATVLGNADAFLLEVRTESAATGRELEVREWTLKQLSPAHLPELGGEALEPYLGHEAALLAGGHTHLQWTRRIDEAIYVNPGSVGISYDRHPDELALRSLAEWALVTIENGAVAVEFRQVPYSAEDVQAAARRSGRPHAGDWAAQWRASSRP
jgi:putative phosphoesterase